MPIDRVVEDLRELAARTSTADGAQRVAWGPVWRDARAWYAAKVAELGLEVRTDAAGNGWVTLPGESDDTVIVGGHLDSVPNGGWLDGALGMMVGLGALRHYAGRRPPRTIAVVDWADEEGARFGRSLLGSSAAAGSLKVKEVRDLVDREGTRLADALQENGVDIDRMLDAHAALKKIPAVAYLELHIEQGPVLESQNLPTGVVLGTFGVERHMLRFVGQAAHSGSTPIPMRRDAFLAAAETAVACREIGLRHSTPEAGVVCTVGMVKVEPGIVTAVPGVCEISLDQRALDAGVLGTDARRGEGRLRRGGAGAPGLGRVAHAVANRAASVRSGADRTVRRSRAGSDRRRAAPPVGTAPRRRRDGAAHAGRHDVRALRPRPVALQGGGYARALPETDDRGVSQAGGEGGGVGRATLVAVGGRQSALAAPASVGSSLRFSFLPNVIG